MTTRDLHPHSQTAEEAVLGAVLVDPATLTQLNGLTSDDFYVAGHSLVWEAIEELANSGAPVEILTVKNAMEQAGTLRRLDGQAEALARLADLGATPSTVDHYAAEIQELSRRRRFITAARQGIDAARKGEPPEVMAGHVLQAADLVREAGVRGIPESWTPIDVAAVMAGIAEGVFERPRPTIGLRSDGAGLFYAGRLNGLFGRYGSAKSFVAMVVAVSELEAGHTVWWVDFEDNPFGTAERLVDLGADPSTVADSFRYLNPHEALTTDSVRAVTEAVAVEEPSLVVVDSSGEWMALQGVQPNYDDEVAAFYKTYVGPFTRAGAGVVAVDHIPHEAKDKLRAIGSQRKGAAVTGVSYLVETLLELGRGRAGKAKLVAAKDRLGHYPRGQVVAEVSIDATTSPYTTAITAPASGDFRPTFLMERVSTYLAQHPNGLAKRAIRDAKLGKHEFVEQALGLLVAGGYVAVEDGPRGALIHRSIQPYHQDDTDPETLLTDELGATPADDLPDAF